MDKLATKAIFLFAVALFFGVVSYSFREVDVAQFFARAGMWGMVELMLLGLLFHLSFGLIMWVGFRLHYGLKLNTSEILVLPMMMHLFLYLMPIKGGMFFQVFYSKQKYGLDLSSGFSFGVLVFLNSLLLTIVLGLVLVYTIPVRSLELKVLIWGMAAAPLALIIFLRSLPNEKEHTNRLSQRFANFMIRAGWQLKEQLNNTRLFIALSTTTLASMLIQSLWFWKMSEILGLQSEFLPVMLVVLILRILMLIRLLPGNLGIQELMIAAVFSAAGFRLEDGLLIGVITRLISVFWTTIIGLPALFSNLHYFESATLRGLIERVAKSNK
jgi:uncharacterized membrane protein YbhN (UPF0104 family)